MTDYKFGYNDSVNMGPSNLLKASGTQRLVPRIGDYHINLTKNFGYNPTGPGQYTLPALFDNLKNPHLGCSPGVKRNPHMDMQHNYNKKLFLSKAHLREQLMTESPDADHNYPVRDKTFEYIRFKQTIIPETSSKGTWSKTARFGPKSSINDYIKTNVPCQYQQGNKFGQGLTQAKQPAPFVIG